MIVRIAGAHFSLDGVLYLSSVEFLDLTNPEKSGWKFAKPLLSARVGLALFGDRCDSIISTAKKGKKTEKKRTAFTAAKNIPKM